MTLSHVAHSIFGGCVSVRHHAGKVGVWSPVAEHVWQQTACDSVDELRAKLSGMPPQPLRFDHELYAQVEPIANHPVNQERMKRARANGSKRTGVGT